MKFWSGLLLLFSATAGAAEIRLFNDPLRDALYHQLVGERRCLVCKPKAPATVGAETARDIRLEIASAVKADTHTDPVARFLAATPDEADLVDLLIKPLMLWSGPIFILACGVVYATRQWRDRRLGPGDLTADERRRLYLLKRNLEG